MRTNAVLQVLVRLPILALLCTPAPALAGEADERAAAKVLEERMKTKRPEDLNILRAVHGKNVIVVAGSMDHIEQVLAAANIRHRLISPAQVASYDLNADQILMINCPGNIPAPGIKRIEKFVRAGGLLYTTDWALLNVIQKAFPGTIAHNGASTGDHVTSVHVHEKHDNLMSDMLLRKNQEPQWYLEGGSYPIKILNKKKVKVLASSKEMARKYKAGPVVVRFRWDDGQVIHVVSHFYRQLNARGPVVASKKVIDQYDGLSPMQKKAIAADPAGDVSAANLESSYAFQQMTSNLVVGKQKDNEDLDKQYQYTPKAAVKVEGRKVAKGGRLKILSRKGRKARVRDDRGNEGEVDMAELEAR